MTADSFQGIQQENRFDVFMELNNSCRLSLCFPTSIYLSLYLTLFLSISFNILVYLPVYFIYPVTSNNSLRFCELQNQNYQMPKAPKIKKCWLKCSTRSWIFYANTFVGLQGFTIEVAFCVLTNTGPHTKRGPLEKWNHVWDPWNFLQQKFQFQLFCMLGQQTTPKSQSWITILDVCKDS